MGLYALFATVLLVIESLLSVIKFSYSYLEAVRACEWTQPKTKFEYLAGVPLDFGAPFLEFGRLFLPLPDRRQGTSFYRVNSVTKYV